MHNMHYETKSTQVKSYCIILGHDYLSTIGLNPDQCLTNTWFNHAIHGHSFSNLTSFAHSKGIEDVLESYSFHNLTVESTQLDTPRCIPENITALQNITRIMQLHCANIHHFSVLRNIHIGKFTHIGMQNATLCSQSFALFSSSKRFG